MFGDVVHDGLNELLDTGEGATTNPLVGDVAKPSLDKVQPRTTRRDEVRVKAAMTFEPTLDSWMLVGCVVVDDQVQVKISRPSANSSAANRVVVPLRL